MGKPCIKTIDILEASKNFDEMYCVGVGSSAKVYKVEIPGSQVLAVKKLSSHAEGVGAENIKSFTNELAALTEIRHRNIVKLLGFCFNEEHMFFIYEFMKRGNLADILSSQEAKELNWETRVRIVKGVAYALSYMHHDCVPPIIHIDISSKHILLSSDFEACVFDFGTAKFLKPDSSNWTTIVGTYGYLAPSKLQIFSHEFFAKLKHVCFRTLYFCYIYIILFLCWDIGACDIIYLLNKGKE